VISDERAAVRELTEYIVSLGHNRIGFISGPTNYLSTRERFLGFIEGLTNSGISFDTELKSEGVYSFESGKHCSRELLTKKNPPTAIVVSNDDMAAGAIHTANEMGIDVPGNLSIAGFDDSRLASMILPTLTTIRRPVTKMSTLAAVKLIAALDDKDSVDAPNDLIVVPKVIVRESTGPIDSCHK
jgi:LacI family transcriptional regulator